MAVPVDSVFIASGFTKPFSIKVFRLHPESLGYNIQFFFSDFTNCTGASVVASEYFGNASCTIVNMTEIAVYNPREPVGTPLFSAVAAFTLPQPNLTAQVYRDKILECDGSQCVMATPSPTAPTSAAPTTQAAPTTPTVAPVITSAPTAPTSADPSTGAPTSPSKGHGAASAADIGVMIGAGVFAVAVVLGGLWWKQYRHARRAAMTESYVTSLFLLVQIDSIRALPSPRANTIVVITTLQGFTTAWGA